ncbi:uncharacterized protein LOC111377797 isoform X2 [Olea europaea var. sylvestris]|uniref:uncharacterized protein LOC111377797 isoform X2 n=1 Tax=Olea europaea var. sylvestris TaxID=158386 RepID=UPI000C1D1B01|nr:uncharacterized protein LOC111377797 isoform X2 [Olea europaea var. sylvestris]
MPLLLHYYAGNEIVANWQEKLFLPRDIWFSGSFLVNQCLEFVNSILVNFGISREMHNPVAIFLLVGIILAGAGFGYWLVRKFVVSEDGTVDIGIAQSVKWGMRMIGVTFILQVGFQCTFMTWIMFIR